MKPNDLEFEVWPEPPKTGMRVGMPRGVKVTHIPTGMVETCDSERSMHANRDKAVNALAARLMQPANAELRGAKPIGEASLSNDVLGEEGG